MNTTTAYEENICFSDGFGCTRRSRKQQYKYGFKAGVNLSNQIKNNTAPTPIKAQETKPLLGYQAGAFYKAKLCNHFFISTEVDFSLIGSKTKYVTEQQVLYPDNKIHYSSEKLGYIELPFTFQYAIHKIYLGTGPGVGLRLFSKITEFENRSYNASYYKTIDIFGNVRAGFAVSRKIDLTVSYRESFVDAAKEYYAYDIKNKSFNFSVYYSLK